MWKYFTTSPTIFLQAVAFWSSARCSPTESLRHKYLLRLVQVLIARFRSSVSLYAPLCMVLPLLDGENGAKKKAKSWQLYGWFTALSCLFY